MSLRQVLPSEWPGRGAWSLPAPGAEGEDWLDAVLEALRHSGLRTAWLPAAPALVSNLSLIENCLLPVQWHERLGRATLEARFANALGQLGLSAEDATRFRQRPAQASALERQQAVMLRVLMQQPQAVVFAAGSLRGRHAGEALERVWPAWMSDSLLLYLGSDGPWPELTGVAGGSPGE